MKKCAESKTQLLLSVNFFLELVEASKAFNMQRRANSTSYIFGNKLLLLPFQAADLTLLIYTLMVSVK